MTFVDREQEAPLCGHCHAELSWLWSNSPPVPYAEWLRLRPASAIVKFLLMCEQGFDIGLGKEAVTRLLRRPP